MRLVQEIVRLTNVWVNYDDVSVLEGIDLSIKQRDLIGVIGPNGSGKTTLLKIILGLLRPHRGEVAVFGHSPEISRRYIGYVPQHVQLDPEFPISVLDVALMGRLGHGNLFSRYDQDDKRRASEALTTVGMFHLRDRQIGSLSGGQLQRVLIARALASNPRLLLLDEPTASIDRETAEEFHTLLEKLTEEMSIILVSHDITALAHHANRIVFMNRKIEHSFDTKEKGPAEIEEMFHSWIHHPHGGITHTVPIGKERQ